MRLIVIVLVCLCYSIKGKSQTVPALEISGKVIDSASHKPLDYATVVLKDAKRISVKSVLTRSDGAFTLTGVRPGSYVLTIVSVGYRPAILPVNLTESFNLGTVAVKAVSEKLKEVVVTADRPLIRQEIDRISYDVKADPESRMNSVLEMMRKVPLLSLDADDNIQLQGDGNFKILINGKPSGMVERNPKDILRSMPASSIEKIEVITTPPAKYDGEGLAGIINIVTAKKADNGYNASVNVSDRFPVGGPGAGGSLTFKTGKFGVSIMGGGSQNKSPETINAFSRQTNGANPTRLSQTGSRTFSGSSGYGGAELSFEIDSLNLISGQVNYNGNASNNRISQNSELNGSADMLQRYELQNLREASGRGVDAALNYQLGFKNDKTRLLTLSYRYLGYSNSQWNNVSVFNPVSYTQPDFRQDNTGEAAEQTFQVDYVHPIKKVIMELGVKAIFRTNASDYRADVRNTSGIFEPDDLQTNRFN
ncbi:MAG TPA: carboxypeptidase regulatory-like domain-containing protein, partial [Sphingobacteriaceae bacterium]